VFIEWSRCQHRDTTVAGGSKLLRIRHSIRHSTALFCYGCAWLSMLALISMLVIAETLQGEAKVSDNPGDANAVANLYLVRRPRR
jgi:hypothetical protein